MEAGGREELANPRELTVLRPEVVPPLADAVRLVDREARDAESGGELEESRRQQPLGGDEDEMVAPAGDLALGGADLAGVHAAVDGHGREAARP